MTLRYDLLTKYTEAKALLHVSTTGSGASLLGSLWEVPGCSAYLCGYEMPYSREQLQAFLGHELEESYVSEDVALLMAMASYVRAVEQKELSGNEHATPIGLGITSSVATTKLPRGMHHAHLALVSADSIRHTKVDLVKGVGPDARKQHDDLIAGAALSLLGGSGEKAALKATETFYRRPIFMQDGTSYASVPGARLYLPATLDPLTDGHRTAATRGELSLSPKEGSIAATYLVSSVTPHKRPMTVQEMLDKVGTVRAERWRSHDEQKELGGSRPIEFTRDESTFIDKARKRPKSTFIIGADAMQRMLSPEWGIPIEPMLNEMKNLDVRFLVMGRVIKGRWTTCRDIRVSWSNQILFVPLDGRIDVSSTEIRAAKSRS